MTPRLSRLAAPFFIFVVVGGAWAALGHFVPPGTAHDAGLLVLGFSFASAYLWLLVSRVRGLLARTGRVPVQLSLVIIDVLLMVGTFALVYSGIGLLDNTSDDQHVVHSFPIALYYSVVTFTTLGYGDFYPMGIGRVLAAAEAAIGYLVLGVIASTAASLLSPHNPAGGLGRHERKS